MAGAAAGRYTARMNMILEAIAASAETPAPREPRREPPSVLIRWFGPVAPSAWEEAPTRGTGEPPAWLLLR
jgi:hypothetical protein